MSKHVQGDAIFAENGTLRLRLDRWWKGDAKAHYAERLRNWALICMINPSIAGADDHDPTIHSCIALFRALGFDGLTVVNQYPYVATDPRDLRRWRANAELSVLRTINELNLAQIRRLSALVDTRVVAWGNLVDDARHARHVIDALSLDGRHKLLCFGRTQDGHPKHPLARGLHRIAPGTPLVTWRAAAAPVDPGAHRTSKADGSTSAEVARVEPNIGGVHV